MNSQIHKKKYSELLRDGIIKILHDQRSYLLGEDISQPYGGAFKITKQLSLLFPKQVLQMPMSEQSFTGMGVGMSLSGLNIMVQIMFGDFITLCVDQLINHASKFIDVFNKKLNFVIRTPMGGFRGYGATHSQSLEKLFFGIPNLLVVSPSILTDPGELLFNCIYIGTPILFIQNKTDYPSYMFENFDWSKFCDIEQIQQQLPIKKLCIKNENKPKWVIVSYGGMVKQCVYLQQKLYTEDEINIDIISPSLIFPLQQSLISLIKNYQNIIVLEQGYQGAGWFGQVLRNVVDNGSQKIYSFSAKLNSIPSSKFLECKILPNIQEIYKFVVEEENGQ